MNKEFEEACPAHESGEHDYTIIKRWGASDWYYCTSCKVLFDENRNIKSIDLAPLEVVELIRRIETHFV
nr:hypothetical protein [uncultured Carboxylicivirga sp.]